MSAFLLFLAKLTLWCALPFALRPLLARRSAATRHLLLTLTLAGALALPALWVAAPQWQAPFWLSLPRAESPVPAPTLSLGAVHQRASYRETGSWTTSVPSPAHLGVAEFQGGTSSAPTPRAWRMPESRKALQTSAGAASLLPRQVLDSLKTFAGGLNPGWLLLVWILGAVGVALHTALLWWRARRLVREADAVDDDEALAALANACRRLGVSTAADLRESPGTPVPFAWRNRGTAVVLPRTWRRWNAERLTVVLVHELAHLRRRDGIVLWIGRAATAVWWFHPLVHSLDRWARRECERAADDAVLLSGSRASDYADHLLAIGRALARPLPAGVSLMMSKSPDFKQRLTAILRADQPRRTLSRRLAFGATVTALAVAVALAGVHFGPTANAQEGDQAEKTDSSHDHGSHYAYQYEHDKDIPEGPEGDSARAMEAHRAGRYDVAIAGFEAAATAGIRPAVSTYNAACGYSLSGRSVEALDSLRKALDLGLDDLDLLTEDSDLDPLRADPRFQALVDEAFAKAGETRDPIDGYRYRTAMERVKLLRESNSQNADAWSDAGTELIRMGEPDLAAEALANAARLAPEPSANTIYNLACVYAMDGKKAPALMTLEQAIEAGYSNPDHMMKDPDLASLRGDATFNRLVKLAEDLDLDRFRAALWKERNHKGHGKDDSSAWDSAVELYRGLVTGKLGHRNSEYSTTAWAPAIEFYQSFVKENPRLGAGWFNLGYSLHYSKRFDEAIPAFEKARALGFRPSTSKYNVACGLSMLDRVDAAVAALEAAVELGFESGDLSHDSDLENLRDDPRFRSLVLKQQMARREH